MEGAGKDETDFLLDEAFIGGINMCKSYMSGNNSPSWKTPLSSRGEKISHTPSDIVNYSKMARIRSFYDKKNNPEGVLDLGSSVNVLCQDMITKKLNSLDSNTMTNTRHISNSGSSALRGNLADFFAQYFSSGAPINPRNLTVTCSVETSLRLLLTMVCDPGDGCLVFTPSEPTRVSSVCKETGLKLIHYPLLDVGPSETSLFTINMKALEDVISKSWLTGVTIKAAVLDNPKNPTGDVMSEPELQQLIEALSRHRIHLIVDETCALSTFPSHPFTSILSIDKVPNKYLVHFIWGFPQEFKAAGISCGILHTMIPTFSDMCAELLTGISVPVAVEEKLSQTMQDQTFMKKYIQENMKKVIKAYEFYNVELSKFGIEVRTNGGNNIWINLSKFIATCTEEEEQALFQEFLEAGLFVIPGAPLLCAKPGWFRISFTNDEHINEMAMEKLSNVLQNRM